MHQRPSHRTQFPFSWLLIAIIVAAFSSLGALTSHATITVSGSSITGDSAFDAFTVPGTPAASSSSQLLELGPNAISGGSPSGTYVGINPSSFAGDFLDFQINSTTVFKVDSSGNITANSISTTEFDSSGAISINASGTNQNITLAPSGTGVVDIASGGVKFPDGTTQTTAAGAGQVTAYYVDSVNGSDSNSGTSAAAPFKTIAKLLTKSWCAAGMTVYFARGSVFYGDTSDSSNIMLPNCNSQAGVSYRAYGAGSQAPIFDGANIAPNASFSLASGETYTYQISWSNQLAGGIGGTGFFVWEDSGNGQRMLTLETSEANVEANACSYYAPAPPANPATIYVHACDSTDVATNGYKYEITVKDYGIDAGGNTLVEGLHFRNFGDAGEQAIGSGEFKNDIFEWGGDHEAYIGSGVVDGCLFLNSNVNANSYAALILYNSSAPGRSLIVRDSTFIGGDPWNPDDKSLNLQQPVYAHDAGTGQYDSISILNNKFYNWASGVSGSAKVYTVIGNTFKRIGQDVIVPSAASGQSMNLTVLDNYIDGSNPKGWASLQAVIVPSGLASGKVLIAGNVINVQGHTNTLAVIALNSPTTDIVQNNTLVHPNTYGTAAAIYLASGNLTFNNNIVRGYPDYVNAAAGSTFTANYNSYYSSGGLVADPWTVNGTAYATFAAYQTGTGQDTNGSNSDPSLTLNVWNGDASVPRGGWADLNRAGASYFDVSMLGQGYATYLGYSGPTGLDYAPGTVPGQN